MDYGPFVSFLVGPSWVHFGVTFALSLFVSWRQAFGALCFQRFFVPQHPGLGQHPNLSILAFHLVVSSCRALVWLNRTSFRGIRDPRRDWRVWVVGAFAGLGASSFGVRVCRFIDVRLCNVGPTWVDRLWPIPRSRGVLDRILAFVWSAEQRRPREGLGYRSSSARVVDFDINSDSAPISSASVSHSDDSSVSSAARHADAVDDGPFSRARATWNRTKSIYSAVADFVSGLSLFTVACCALPVVCVLFVACYFYFTSAHGSRFVRQSRSSGGFLTNVLRIIASLYALFFGIQYWRDILSAISSCHSVYQSCYELLVGTYPRSSPVRDLDEKSDEKGKGPVSFEPASSSANADSARDKAHVDTDDEYFFPGVLRLRDLFDNRGVVSFLVAFVALGGVFAFWYARTRSLLTPDELVSEALKTPKTEKQKLLKGLITTLDKKFQAGFKDADQFAKIQKLITRIRQVSSELSDPLDSWAPAKGSPMDPSFIRQSKRSRVRYFANVYDQSRGEREEFDRLVREAEEDRDDDHHEERDNKYSAYEGNADDRARGGKNSKKEERAEMRAHRQDTGHGHRPADYRKQAAVDVTKLPPPVRPARKDSYVVPEVPSSSTPSLPPPPPPFVPQADSSLAQNVEVTVSDSDLPVTPSLMSTAQSEVPSPAPPKSYAAALKNSDSYTVVTRQSRSKTPVVILPKGLPDTENSRKIANTIFNLSRFDYDKQTRSELRITDDESQRFYSWLTPTARQFITNPEPMERRSTYSTQSTRGVALLPSTLGRNCSFRIHSLRNGQSVDHCTGVLLNYRRSDDAKTNDIYAVTAAHLLPSEVAAAWQSCKDFVWSIAIDNTSEAAMKNGKVLTTNLVLTQEHAIPASWLPGLDVFVFCVTLTPGFVAPRACGGAAFTGIRATNAADHDDRPPRTLIVTPEAVGVGSAVYTGAHMFTDVHTVPSCSGAPIFAMGKGEDHTSMRHLLGIHVGAANHADGSHTAAIRAAWILRGLEKNFLALRSKNSKRQ